MSHSVNILKFINYMYTEKWRKLSKYSLTRGIWFKPTQMYH